MRFDASKVILANSRSILTKSNRNQLKNIVEVCSTPEILSVLAKVFELGKFENIKKQNLGPLMTELEKLDKKKLKEEKRVMKKKKPIKAPVKSQKEKDVEQGLSKFFLFVTSFVSFEYGGSTLRAIDWYSSLFKEKKDPGVIVFNDLMELVFGFTGENLETKSKLIV